MVCRCLWGPVFHPFGIYPEVELLHFLRNPVTCFPHFPFTFPPTVHKGSNFSRPASTLVTLFFTVAIFMMVRSVILKYWKIRSGHKNQVLLPSFLLFLSIFTASTAANINYQCGQPCQPPNKGTTKHISISQANPAKVGIGLYFTDEKTDAEIMSLAGSRTGVWV